ncbi:unnamed protein product [Owenia fusiformis]|uniref:Palmitoyltransferase n=1 Tax=Owenia fusiformis TaxID=6347 RepID=A0A8S4NKG0_OWEFU|nr:unnamed protein product [Owenia fusiformis]
MAEEKSKAEKKCKEQTLTEKYNKFLSKIDNFQVTPEDVNRFAPMWFIIVMFFTFYLGQLYIVPTVHATYQLSFNMECFLYGVLYLAFIELLVNWYYIRNVESKHRNTTQTVKTDDNHAHNGDENDAKKDKNEGTMDGGDMAQTDKLKSSAKRDNGQDTGSLVYKRFRGDGQIYAVKMPSNGAKSEQPVMYSYWSWKPCLTCKRNVPPRAHHCPLCKACILKRDHHCYFTGQCIGLNNQRHFIVFTFWIIFASTVYLTYTLLYTYIMIFNLGQLSWMDIFLPATFVRWCMGYTAFYQVILYFVVYSLAFFMMLSFRYIIFQLRFIRKGITSFEYECKIKIKNANSFYEELISVFGDHGYMNFIFPCHDIFPLRQDALDWPNIKQ